LRGVREAIAMLKIPKHAKVTLERDYEVVPVPSVLVPGVIIPRAPITILLIRQDVDEEPVVRVGSVAMSTPYSSTGIPGWSGGGKVAAKEAVHFLMHHSTGAAGTGPEPEG
jgi:hypothetical protein